MKRLRTNANLARAKYLGSQYVEHSGIGTRRLTESEIGELQKYVDQVRMGLARPCRPYRLRGDASGR